VADVLVDSNVWLDVISAEDREWTDWSAAMLHEAATHGRLVMNAIVYAEISVRVDSMEDLEEDLGDFVVRRPIPWAAAFLAGKCFERYRRAGGTGTAPLPDFFIGAHAAVEGLTLLTRDPRRFRAYFPKLRIVAP
jgi:predicted nucleic acid-binding protein